MNIKKYPCFSNRLIFIDNNNNNNNYNNGQFALLLNNYDYYNN